MEKLSERVLNSIEKIKPDIRMRLDVPNFVTNGVLDSMDVINIIVAFEDDFGIEVDPVDVVHDNFATIEKMTAFVEKYLSKDGKA